MQILASELERRSAEVERYREALSDAQQTIERLAHESGRQTGRNDELERECERLRGRVAELEERDQYRPGKALRRVQLVHLNGKADPGRPT
jgi:predicted RNase H-like nuclease (RuvC/YqgF family)